MIDCHQLNLSGEGDTNLTDDTILSETYAEHFDKLRETYDRALVNHHFESLVIYSGEIKNRFQDDQPYPFFVNVQFKAIVPLIQAPESWIIWRLGERPTLLFYQPDDFSHGAPELPTSFWISYFEIIILKNKKEAEIYIDNVNASAFFGEITDHIKAWNLGQLNPESLIAELNWYRSYKSAYEQYCIRQANRISIKGHIAARDVFFSGASELEIALAFQHACQQAEEELAFPSIVAINKHASVLHYSGRDFHRISADKRCSLLMDAGASYNGYAADICRTYAHQDGLFAEMIAALDQVQQELVAGLSVGLSYLDSSQEASYELAVLLKTFGIVKLEPDCIVEQDLVRYFMPHGLSHFLGLQTHDVATSQADATGALLDPKPRMVRKIEANQVLTVEPGIYFIDTLLKSLAGSEHQKAIAWDLIEQLKPYGGMRIEDNVLISVEGPVNFTRKEFMAQWNEPGDYLLKRTKD